MLYDGKKAVEDKPDCYGYLDNMEGFSSEDADKSGNCTIWHCEDEEEKQMTLALRGCLFVEKKQGPELREGDVPGAVRSVRDCSLREGESFPGAFARLLRPSLCSPVLV
jgi:hypothetical protein